ncbi:MAG: undecaprenyl-phosphate glucose phosphotransferase [Thermoanaerobaculales bacterium]|nr:undecaprenyl-phosphate glucose phosphotransferase [Thermoanaerobaculales bacterium]
MIERRRQIQVLFHLVGDLFVTGLSVPLAFWCRFHLQVVPLTKGLPDLGHYLVLIPMVVVIWPMVFYFQGLYQRRRIRSRSDELIRLVMSVFLATMLLIAASSFYRPIDFTYSRLFMAVFVVINIVLLVFSRWVVAGVLGRIRRSGRNLRTVLVVGSGDLGRRVVKRLQAHREYGFNVVGFLDDDPGLKDRGFHGVPVVGSTANLESVVESYGVDQVILALPMSAHNKTNQLIRRAGQLLVDVKVVPDLLQFFVATGGVEELDGLPMINLTQIPLRGWDEVLKRAFDICGAAFLLLVTAPLFPFISWRIKRIDGGPAFFSQVRTGLDGRAFRLFKFRSMRITAEKDRTWTRHDDNRITPIGAFLRRTNLDELPQLFNVLKGDMSLVGPRPEQPEFVERFRARYPEYNTRHRVRAGLTGWAQVNGLRGDTSIRQRVVHDLYYIENWSFALDLKILLRTLWQVGR